MHALLELWMGSQERRGITGSVALNVFGGVRKSAEIF